MEGLFNNNNNTNNNNNNNNNNNQDDIYSVVIMAEPLREFARFTGTSSHVSGL